MRDPLGGAQQSHLTERSRMRAILAVVVALPVLVTPLAAQAARVVFEGFPLRKVESSFLETTARALNDDEAFEYHVRIVERNGRYYWASREMRELIRSESGAYITYHAGDGSGYIRVGTPFLLDLRDRLPQEQREREIGYVEHLLIQYGSVTYYGNRK